MNSRKFIYPLLVVAVITVSLSARVRTTKSAHQPQSINVEVDSDRWSINDPKAKKEDYLGRKSLFLSSNGTAVLKDLEFEDGTIEVDVASMPVSFPGILFRFNSSQEHELVYLRPHHSGHDDATQYVPAFHGSHPWQIYNGKGYTATANLPSEKWQHMKIEISGLVARVFLADAKEPTLVITDLKHGFSKGTIGITSGAQGAHFANFSFVQTPAAAHTQPQYPAPAPGTITKWELSEALPTETTSAEVLPAAAELERMNWESVATETPGMVVIDRYRTSGSLVAPFAFDRSLRLAPSKGTKLVFARAVITSDRDQVVRMGFGYSDEATVFLNRQPLFSGKSAWRFRDQDFNGVMDVENDAIYLPLKKGRNELVLAVKEYFGGWGFICRLESPNGVKIN